MTASDDSPFIDLHTLAEQVNVSKRTLQRWMTRGAIEHRHDAAGYRTLFSPRGVLQAHALSALRAGGVSYEEAIAKVAAADLPTLRAILEPASEGVVPAAPTLPVSAAPAPAAPIETAHEAPVVESAPAEVPNAVGVGWHTYEVMLGVELSVRDDAGVEAKGVVAEILARFGTKPGR